MIEVIVKNNNVEKAIRVLKKKMLKEEHIMKNHRLKGKENIKKTLKDVLSLKSKEKSMEIIKNFNKIYLIELNHYITKEFYYG